jgi:hypothetical protein
MKNDLSKNIGVNGVTRVSTRFGVRQEWAQEILGPLSFCALKRIERRELCTRFATCLRSSIVNRQS